MAQRDLKSFSEFWPHYLTEHSKPATRTLHAVGTTVSVACAAALLMRGRWRLLPLAFIPGYAAAWAGHFFIEHNRPATFKHPLWSLVADYKMIGLMLSGKIEEEVEQAKLNQPPDIRTENLPQSHRDTERDGMEKSCDDD